MIVEFEEKDHIYSVNGDIANISVTELLKKHGLSPDYGNTNKQVLKKSAEQGKVVHKDLENILNVANYEPTTEQGKEFKEWVCENIDCGVGEQLLGYEQDGFILAGTADVMAIGSKKQFIIGDHKNTSTFDREYVSWQVSLLDFMARKLGKEKINGKILNWKGAVEFYCFWYDKKTGKLTVKELERVPDVEIQRLIDCEIKGEFYQRPALVLDKELEEQYLACETAFAKMELDYKKMKEQVDAVRGKMLNLMEEQKILSYESKSGRIKVTYVAPYNRNGIDNSKLKEKYPQIFTECQKLTPVKASIKVTVRGDEDGE